MEYGVGDSADLKRCSSLPPYCLIHSRTLQPLLVTIKTYEYEIGICFIRVCDKMYVKKNKYETGHPSKEQKKFIGRFWPISELAGFTGIPKKNNHRNSVYIQYEHQYTGVQNYL